MKVLIFATAYLPFAGGAELAIKEITDRLPHVSFTLITARFARSLLRQERLGNVEVYRVGGGCGCDKWMLPLRAFRLAEALEKSEHFDVIWSMMASQGSIAAARFKRAFPKKRLVLTVQEGDEEEYLKRYALGSDFLYRLFIRPWHLSVFKRADAITAISAHLAERARRNAPNTPVEVIPNGVDIEKFKNQNPKIKIAELRKRLQFSEKDNIVITTSRLVPKNGVGDLVGAMRYLPEETKLLILGDGPLRRNLQRTTYNLQLNDRVRFLGAVPHGELPEYLSAADVFCRPSRSEGFGSSFIEAMAAGVPVVATPVGGIPDFLFAPLPESETENHLFSHSHELEERWGETITGLFCEAGNPKSIAGKIQILLSDSGLRERIIANAGKMVLEKYQWDGIASVMERVFFGS